MGWWESFTDALGFTNHAEEAASHELSDYYKSLGADAAEAIRQGREELIKFYAGGEAALDKGYSDGFGMFDSRYGMARDELARGTQDAVGRLENASTTAQNIAKQYYTPFQDPALAAARGLGVLSGTVQGSPEETARLLEASPMYQFRQQEQQKALDRALRAKGLSNSRYAAGKSTELTDRLTADEMDRRINQLMGLYNASVQGMGTAGGFGVGVGKMGLDSGSEAARIISNSSTNMAGNLTEQGTNALNTAMSLGKMKSGLKQDLGQSVASSYGAAQSAINQGFAAGAQAEAGAHANKPNPLQTAIDIYTAGSGTWW